MESLIKKIDGCENSPGNSSTTKIGEHIPCGYFANDKNYRTVRDHCHCTSKYRGPAHDICNLRFNVPNEIPVVFHSSSNYEYHFIIKELANEFEG